MNLSVEEVQNKINECTALVEKYEKLAVEARAERLKWRGQLAPARHREKLALQAAQVRRPRGRPVNPNALSGLERLQKYKEAKKLSAEELEQQRREKLHKEAKRLSTPEVEVICVLKKK